MRSLPTRRYLATACHVAAAAAWLTLGPPAAAQKAPQKAPPSPAADATTAPSYAQLIEEELNALKLFPKCTQAPGALECAYLGRSSMGERRFDVRATYREDTRSVEIQIRHFLEAPVSHPATDALLKRLMAINWSLLAARFSWNADTGEVRLGATLHTDSNFDRRAFRSLVRALDDLGPRYHPELLNLQRSLRAPADKPR